VRKVSKARIKMDVFSKGSVDRGLKTPASHCEKQPTRKQIEIGRVRNGAVTAPSLIHS
jgi:hypothetical protein